ncbi:MAG: DotA/TraY family protein, partial [Proteobacteria bacterium]|nr:DotA/TraY family protein [Pseudomonadota bacterium]
QIIKYAALPGLLPRAGRLFFSGFSHIAMYMAAAFHAARLLPYNHPYLRADSIGRYGMRHVLMEARRNLVIKRENIDQVIIYYAVLGGIFLLFAQFLILGFSLFSGAAHASGITPAFLQQFFSTPNATDDVAFVLLDLVFGIPGVFTDVGGGITCVAAGIPCFTNQNTAIVASWPGALHSGMLLLFQFYNTGILAVGLIVFLYLVATTVGETAVTGSPFGKRFNRTWAVPRMIFAIALLVIVPFGTNNSFGMNVAQIMTLRIAKWGSGLATNAWILFNTELGSGNSTPMGQPENLVVLPNPPHFNTLLEWAYTVHTCRWIEGWLRGPDGSKTIEVFQIYGNNAVPMPGGFQAAVTNARSIITPTTSARSEEIVIVIGEIDPAYNKYPGSVRPICGEIVVQVKDLTTPGAQTVQERYYDILLELLVNDALFWADGEAVARRFMPIMEKDPFSPVPFGNFLKTDYIDYYDDLVRQAILAGRADQVADPNWFPAVTDMGWGGAGIWYNRVAQYNGSYIAASFSLPTPKKYPEVMEQVRMERARESGWVTGIERYNPKLPDGTLVNLAQPDDIYAAMAYYYAVNSWQDLFIQPTGNIFQDTITAVLGLEGLFNLVDNVSVHPLAQLVGVGRSMVESSMMNLGFSFGAGLFGGLANLLGRTEIGGLGISMADFAVQIGLMGLSIGFILYYILPFMPFIYFFFATMTWIRSIFEAMVGVPLWALAHIHIDGEGLPGPAGLDGYYLMFEIMIRPILIVFGLLAGLAIFAAQVYVLHEIWHLAVTNITGFDNLQTKGYQTPVAGQTGSLEFMRDPVSSFFYTALYAIIVYLQAVASFKLVDLIPDNILRWMGASVTSFGEIAKDPAEQLLTYAAGGSQVLQSTLQKGAQGGLDVMRNLGRNK